MLLKLKRDLLSFYFSVFFLRFYMRGQYASCMQYIAKIELLESNISETVSYILNSFLKHKYNPADNGTKGDPFILSIIRRFSEVNQRKFLSSNIIVLKPYLSPKEKGVILLNYTEIINSFPFLFDLNKIQERYHIVLEPSWESPYQMYYRLYQSNSIVFVQSLSKREIAMDKKQGFVDVPVCAGDWINESKFFMDENAVQQYDFCAIANFISFKRHEFLFSALSQHWKGDLKFALIASSHVGNNREWIEKLMAKYNVQGKVDMFIDVLPEEVNKVLNQSKCHVLCSLREGANRANFESMYIGTPVVVHKHHIGFPNFRFDGSMVFNFTNAENFVAAIKASAKANRKEVAAKAQRIIGSEKATYTLNEYIKKETLAKGGIWTLDIFRKVNVVHLFYADVNDAQRCSNDYKYLSEMALSKQYYDFDFAIKRYCNS